MWPMMSRDPERSSQGRDPNMLQPNISKTARDSDAIPEDHQYEMACVESLHATVQQHGSCRLC